MLKKKFKNNSESDNLGISNKSKPWLWPTVSGQRQVDEKKMAEPETGISFERFCHNIEVWAACWTKSCVNDSLEGLGHRDNIDFNCKHLVWQNIYTHDIYRL